MRRLTYWALSTVSVLVLLFSYRTSTSSSFATGVVAAGSANAGTDASGAGTTDSAGADDTSADTSGTGAATPTPSATTPAATTPSASSTKTFTGDAISTRFGDVQVRITVVAGKVTTSVVTQVPWSDHRDQEINSYAVPILNGEAVTAQSAQIDMVSGATFTSDGYIQSLQSALDQANL